MAGTARDPMTREEMLAFAKKLETWGQGLAPKEQAFLEEILARSSAGEGGEVQGFMTKADRVPTIEIASWDWGNIPQGRFSSLLPFDDGSLGIIR
jgi:hypothetical protein